MLIVVDMGRWSDDNVCRVVHDVRLYSVLDAVVISGEDVCCSVVLGTLVGVSVCNVIWSDFLMISVTSCLLLSAVYDTYHLFNCTHISTTLSPLDLWTATAGVT